MIGSKCGVGARTVDGAVVVYYENRMEEWVDDCCSRWLENPMVGDRPGQVASLLNLIW